MNAFLTSIGYNHWVLPVLLALPALGALVVWGLGATARRATGEAMERSGTWAPAWVRT